MSSISMNGSTQSGRSKQRQLIIVCSFIHTAIVALANFYMPKRSAFVFTTLANFWHFHNQMRRNNERKELYFQEESLSGGEFTYGKLYNLRWVPFEWRKNTSVDFGNAVYTGRNKVSKFIYWPWNIVRRVKCHLWCTVARVQRIRKWNNWVSGYCDSSGKRKGRETIWCQMSTWSKLCNPNHSIRRVEIVRLGFSSAKSCSDPNKNVASRRKGLDWWH